MYFLCVLEKKNTSFFGSFKSKIRIEKGHTRTLLTIEFTKPLKGNIREIEFLSGRKGSTSFSRSFQVDRKELPARRYPVMAFRQVVSPPPWD